jgi:hypothetical protein
MKVYGGMQVQMHHFPPWHNMKVTGQFHILTALPLFHWTGGWKGPGAGWCRVEKDLSLSCYKSNPKHLFHSVSLYWLSYPGSVTYIHMMKTQSNNKLHLRHFQRLYVSVSLSGYHILSTEYINRIYFTFLSGGACGVRKLFGIVLKCKINEVSNMANCIKSKCCQNREVVLHKEWCLLGCYAVWLL